MLKLKIPLWNLDLKISLFVPLLTDIKILGPRTWEQNNLFSEYIYNLFAKIWVSTLFIDRCILYSNLTVISVGQWPCWLKFWLQKWWRSSLISDLRPSISDLNHNEPKLPMQYEPGINQVFGFEPSKIWIQDTCCFRDPKLGYKQFKNKSLW